MLAGLGVHESDVAEIDDAATGVRVKRTIDDDTTGTRQVPGGHKEVLYVFQGRGAVMLDGSRHELEPEVAAHVAGQQDYSIESQGEEDLVLVGVLTPIPDELPDGLGERQTTVRLADQPSNPAGKDRKFWFMVSPAVGCRGVTQFVGCSLAGSRPAVRATTIRSTTRSQPICA